MISKLKTYSAHLTTGSTSRISQLVTNRPTSPWTTLQYSPISSTLLLVVLVTWLPNDSTLRILTKLN